MSMMNGSCRSAVRALGHAGHEAYDILSQVRCNKGDQCEINSSCTLSEWRHVHVRIAGEEDPATLDSAAV